MRTHHIEVKAMTNPAGAVLATLDVAVGEQGDSIEFVYPKGLRANRGAKFFADFETAFTEQLNEKRNCGLPSRELRVSVVKLTCDPTDSSRIGIAGCLAAIDFLKMEHADFTMRSTEPSMAPGFAIRASRAPVR